MFAQSVQSLKGKSNEMISIKVTGLINMKTLKKLNDSVLMRDQFWMDNSQNGELTAEKLFEGLQKMYSGLSEEHF
jgi:hypothetical protein